MNLFSWFEQPEQEVELVFSLFKDRDLEYTVEDIDYLFKFYEENSSTGVGFRYKSDDGSMVLKTLNKLERYFWFYCLYRRLGNEEKAYPFIAMARNFHVRQYVSAYWEQAVYRTFKAMYGMKRAVPDCVLPNRKRPDLVIDPVLDEQNKFDLSGVRILHGKIIVDAKTSLYDISK